MEYPESLRYSREHEWVRVDGGEGDEVVIGITDFAQDALGDVVYVALPEVGAEIAADGNCGEIESTKSVSEIYSPVAGTVVAVNDALGDRPEFVNTDPYGEGWIARLRPSDPAALGDLMDADAYRAFVEE
jgi:glycine cleavage system H protein